MFYCKLNFWSICIVWQFFSDGLLSCSQLIVISAVSGKYFDHNAQYLDDLLSSSVLYHFSSLSFTIYSDIYFQKYYMVILVYLFPDT